MLADRTIDETNAEDGKRLPPVDQALLRKVARSVWTLEFKERSPEASPNERKAAWEVDKKEATARARKLIRRLESDGVLLAVKE